MFVKLIHQISQPWIMTQSSKKKRLEEEVPNRKIDLDMLLSILTGRPPKLTLENQLIA
jgi:hypothetical protein